MAANANPDPLTAPPPGEAPDLSKALSPATAISVEGPRALSNSQRLRFLLVTALGATVGFLTGMGLFSGLRNTTTLEFFLLRVSIAGLAAYVLFDPSMELLQDRFEGKRPELSGGRKFFSLLIIALATVVISLFHESLAASVGDELKEGLHDLESVSNWLFDPSFTQQLSDRVAHLTSPTGGLELALGVFVCVGVVAALVSHLWVSGASKQPPRAALYGGAATAAGALYLVLAATLLWTVWLAPGTLHSRPWAIAAIFLAALLWCLFGLLGGVAIDQHSPRLGLTFRAFLALALPPAILLLLLLPAYELKLKYAFPNHGRLLFLPILALLCQNLGWALALHLRYQAWDHDPKPSPELPEIKQQTIGTVVPFPREDDSLSSAVGQTAATRAKDMVLKPKGDRLWAAIALILALVASGLAFYVGFFRTDPEIVINIEENIRQDSGLRRAGLTVHSSGRRVTISGVVDDETEHAQAVQKALAVRGVTQLIDQIQVAQIQVAPTLPPAPTVPAVAVPASQPNAPAVNATVSIVVPKGTGPVSAVGAQKQPPNPKAADAPKHGFFHLLKKDNPATTTGAQTPAGTPKTADPPKQGFFHFLKKKDSTDKTKQDQTKKDPTKKDQTKPVPPH